MKISQSINSISPTLRILNIVGTPFAETEKASANRVDELHQYAISNKMHLFFLESLSRHNIDTFSEEFKQLVERYERVNETIMKIAETLEKNNIEYSFFKSIRPYKEVTVDIDTIIFNDRQKTTQVLKDAGFKLLEVGPLSTTLRDEKSSINIDLYEEIGISHFIYIDKRKLHRFIVRKRIGDGNAVNSLDAVADLLAIISHSIIKEQMYVLSEYLTTIHYLHQMSRPEIYRLMETAQEWKLGKALSTHLSITSIIHFQAHKFVPKPLQTLQEITSYNVREAERIREKKYVTPYKYHPLTVIDSLLEKLPEPTAKRSLAIQITKLTNPTFASHFIKQASKHLERQEY